MARSGFFPRDPFRPFAGAVDFAIIHLESKFLHFTGPVV
jgi:hypothetical protein